MSKFIITFEDDHVELNELRTILENHFDDTFLLSEIIEIEGDLPLDDEVPNDD